MNKELILKYKAEFDHSLYGGKLQVKFVNDPWEEAPEDIFSYSTVNFVLVIDDAYVEFRKALAEGKTIQLNEAEKFSDQNRGWVDLSCTSLGSSTNLFPVEYYRIKPEESKFKVGDWAVNKTSKQRIIKKVTSVYSDSITVTVGDSTVGINVMLIKDLELWEPKPGEFCWFWNDSDDIPILAKLISIEYFLEKPTEYKIKTPSYISETIYSCMTYMYFKNCEPFIGQLPTILKD